MTLSVCMIVKDEEAVLERCLSCLGFADEIVIVDTGSTDRTREIAARFTPCLYTFSWIDDFSAARNFSFSKATGELVMWLDADDVIDAENQAKFAAVKENMEGYDLAFALYRYASLLYPRERIFRREAGFLWEGAVHEAIVPRGRILRTDAVVLHQKTERRDPMRNLRIYQKKRAAGEPFNPRETYYYGRELYYNRMYAEAAAVLEGFLAGEGWAENKAEACLVLYRIYRALGEKRRAEERLACSLLYAAPKGETCCLLGDAFSEQGAFDTAIRWYEAALRCGNADGFVDTDYGELVPCLQLCVLYDRLGETERAEAYNERAGKVAPNHPSYLHNRAYFAQKRADR